MTDKRPRSELPFKLTPPVRSPDLPTLTQHVESGAPPAEGREERIRDKAARAGIRVTLPGDQAEEDVPDGPIPEVDWVHYDNWPDSIRMKLYELEELEHLSELMDGGATDHDAYTLAMEIIRNGQRGLRTEISRALIDTFTPKGVPQPPG